MDHPRPDDHGRIVVIRHPSQPTPPATWHDPEAVATCVPGGEVPAGLNGVPFAPWDDHPTTADGWNAYAGLKPDLVEPVMQVPAGKAASAGVVVFEPDGRVWVVAPSNGFGGYSWTWPKGRVEDGLSFQATAAREALEESGLQVRIVGLLGDFARTTTVTRYYLAERIGGSPVECGWEAQACSLMPVSALPDMLNGAPDKPVIAALMAKLASGGRG